MKLRWLALASLSLSIRIGARADCLDGSCQLPDGNCPPGLEWAVEVRTADGGATKIGVLVPHASPPTARYFTRFEETKEYTYTGPGTSYHYNLTKQEAWDKETEIKTEDVYELDGDYNNGSTSCSFNCPFGNCPSTPQADCEAATWAVFSGTELGSPPPLFSPGPLHNPGLTNHWINTNGGYDQKWLSKYSNEYTLDDLKRFTLKRQGAAWAALVSTNAPSTWSSPWGWGVWPGHYLAIRNIWSDETRIGSRELMIQFLVRGGAKDQKFRLVWEEFSYEQCSSQISKPSSEEHLDFTAPGPGQTKKLMVRTLKAQGWPSVGCSMISGISNIRIEPRN